MYVYSATFRSASKRLVAQFSKQANIFYHRHNVMLLVLRGRTIRQENISRGVLSQLLCSTYVFVIFCATNDKSMIKTQ